MKSSSIPYINRSTLLTHQQELTERRRVSEMGSEPIDLNLYLKGLQQFSKQRESERRMVKQLMHRSRKLLTTQSPKTIASQTNIVSQKSLFGERGRFRSQRSSVFQKQQFHQEIYNDANATKLQQLNDSLYELVQSISQLKQKLNNERKLYFMLKKAIGLRKQLQKLILDQQSEQIIDPLTITQMKMNIQMKEHILEGPISWEIVTYNFGIINEIELLNKKIHELIIQAEINGIEQIQFGIMTEMDKMNDDETSKNQFNLRFQMRSMRKGALNEELQSMERRLGYFPLISNRNKELDEKLSDVVANLNKKYRKK